MMLYELLYVIFFIWYSLTQCVAAEDEDDYVINFDSSLFVCGDEKSAIYFDTSQVEVSRYNETNTWMFGSIALPKGVDANTLVELYIEKESSGRYDPVGSHEICDVCSEMPREESIYYKYIRNLDIPIECPIPPGEYTIKNFVLYTDYIPMSKTTEGRYQVTLNFYRTSSRCTGLRTFLGCLKVDVVIEPK